MKTKTARHALFAVLAVAALALSSCAEGPAGIFASIASETPTNENMTKAIKDSSQSFVVRRGTTYYAGIGTLWQKADGDTQWHQTGTSAISSATVFAGSAAVIGTDMYVAFFDSATGDDLGVWSFDGITWARVDSGFPAAGRDLRSILAANGNLFAVTANTRLLTTDPVDYSIHHLSGTFSTITAPAGISIPTSVAFDGTATYLFTAGDSILAGDTTALTSLATEPATGAAYSGACFDGTGIIVSNRNGYLYRSTDAGATWTTAGPFADSKDDAYSLSTPTYIADSNVLVVGTNRIPGSSTTPPVGGYLEFDMAGGFLAGMEPTVDHGIISNANNFDTSLTGRSVPAMPLFDLGVPLKIFALTDGYGLWSNTYNGAEWELWVRE